MNKVNIENDTSMEEALASIRQIITKDIDYKDNLKEPSLATAPHFAGEDVLDLTDVVTSNGTIIRLQPNLKNHLGINKREDSQETHSSLSSSFKAEEEKTLKENSDALQETILSDETVKKSLEALKDLNHFHDKTVETVRDGSFGQQTMEEFIVSMIKPMLKTWMDTNLPSLVKWVVAEQIEKLLKAQEKSS